MSSNTNTKSQYNGEKFDNDLEIRTIPLYNTNYSIFGGNYEQKNNGFDH